MSPHGAGAHVDISGEGRVDSFFTDAGIVGLLVDELVVRLAFCGFDDSVRETVEEPADFVRVGCRQRAGVDGLCGRITHLCIGRPVYWSVYIAAVGVDSVEDVRSGSRFGGRGVCFEARGCVMLACWIRSV